MGEIKLLEPAINDRLITNALFGYFEFYFFVNILTIGLHLWKGDSTCLQQFESKWLAYPKWLVYQFEVWTGSIQHLMDLIKPIRLVNLCPLAVVNPSHCDEYLPFP